MLPVYSTLYSVEVISHPGYWLAILSASVPSKVTLEVSVVSISYEPVLVLVMKTLTASFPLNSLVLK